MMDTGALRTTFKIVNIFGFISKIMLIMIILGKVLIYARVSSDPTCNFRVNPLEYGSTLNCPFYLKMWYTLTDLCGMVFRKLETGIWVQSQDLAPAPLRQSEDPLTVLRRHGTGSGHRETRPYTEKRGCHGNSGSGRQYHGNMLKSRTAGCVEWGGLCDFVSNPELSTLIVLNSLEWQDFK